MSSIPLFALISRCFTMSAEAPGSSSPALFQKLFAVSDPFLAKLESLTGLERSVTSWIVALSAVFVMALVLLLLGRIVRLIVGNKDGKDVEITEKTDEENREIPVGRTEVITEKPPAPVEQKQSSQPLELKTEEPKPQGLLRSIRSGLEKTRKALSEKVDRLFSGGGALDEDKLEDLEEMLITADVGVETSMKLIETLSKRSSEISGTEDLKRIIREEIFRIIDLKGNKNDVVNAKPRVIMVVGVNGVGKTTTIGKLAARFMSEGKKVLIVAADTFRAAASEQLAVWAERSGAAIVRHKDNSDPAAVAFDGMEAALSRESDIVLIDTAGRLHTKKNLMEELKKIKRTVSSKIPDAPHETLMVLDATTGQNALQQAKLFNEAIGISTIALTKLDGTAKGGIVIGISHSLAIPITHIGVGEQIDDLKDFDAHEFAEALL